MTIAGTTTGETPTLRGVRLRGVEVNQAAAQVILFGVVAEERKAWGRFREDLPQAIIINWIILHCQPRHR
jgi:hypothetical protein